MVKVRCSFDQGFVAVLPSHLYDPGEPYLMQALIGLSEDPGFWKGLDSYAKLRPYRALPCDRNGQTFSLAPGKFVVAVGRAGQFSVRGKYKDNGFLRHIKVERGNRETIDVRVGDLRHTWNCISCPFLVVFQGGKAVEVGQVLVDRYTRRRRGTDVVRTEADVRDGVLVIRLEEREPETSFVERVTVEAKGKKLRPRRGTAVPALELEMGDVVELEFDASRFGDGPLEVEIAVSGHYEPIGPLL